MKKVIVMLVVTMFSISWSVAQENSFTIDDSQLLAYNSTTTYELLVYASDGLNDLCEYFDGSWLDTGLRIYCHFGGDPVICTAYRVFSVACGINGVVRLTIEGDYNSALKKALNTSTKIFKVEKGRSGFSLTQTSNSCPI